MKYSLIPILLGLFFMLSACDKPDDGKMPKVVTDEIKNEMIEKSVQERKEAK